MSFSLNTLCVIGVLLSNYSLNGKTCGTTLYEKVSHRWVSANELVFIQRVTACSQRTMFLTKAAKERV